MAGALAVSALILSLAPPQTIGPWWVLALLGFLAMAWVVLQPAATLRDDMLPPLAIVLAALGLAVVARVSPDLAQKQQAWLVVSLVLVLLAGPAFTNFRRFAAYKYLWVIASLALFGLLLAFGQEVNGARLWIKLGPVQYEPIELIKLFIVLFLSAYLAEMADVIAAARPWSLRANLKYLGPLFIGWGASMAILVVQRDLGMATLLLFTFATLLFVATRRADIVVLGAAIFAAVAFWAMRHYPYVQTRIAVWRNPFADPLGAGFQSSQSYYALAAGGIFGTGYRLGHPGFIPDVATDYVYAAFSEEFGLLGALLVLLIFLGLVRRIFATGLEQPDLYTKLLAAGLGATLGFQIFIIVGGVIGLFPLTGITLPFVSYGGSSLVANFLLVALVWAMSARPKRPSTDSG
ncbi:MAG: FtsW/RodA/SpoVE family cell cycle protein [Candidatus Eremiobacteraeota bacterium]|nr:FtsW/RodA/SpoVE family cell cycle protein [Candidatus Eremiobacteraeota bacterium]MBV8333098.1 FtsW/RodA/SpoVE family cell cycle protein [Candidatus Eremiobacteraeota bacterium]MBV8434571.1 FtsW/RodA/SpoVE family cell cycle protein [Candidatus Eremiobacteraeota bacterium]MBV8654721.1 FtsW/RodA/SpoVE family cell cycle protein [Candidatus Eremiobacteraeota bacterium]